MSGDAYWTNMLTGVGSLDELSFSMPQETQTHEDVEVGAGVEAVEVQEVHEGVEVQGGASAEAEMQEGAGGVRRPRVPRPNAIRQKNFNPKEDEIVVSAWLNVSKDPVQGANQSHASFWHRVYEYYEANRDPYPSRTESSIMHRWGYIQEMVNKYCACYDAIVRKNQSGSTIHDKVSEASTVFKALNQDKTFTLMHCWNKLKGEDKWKAKMKEMAKMKQPAKKKQKVHKDSSPRDVEVNNTEDANGNPPDSEAPKRPMGQKKAKEALRRGGGEACMEALDKMSAKEAFDMEKEKKKEEWYIASLELDKKRLALEEKQVEADMMEKKKRLALEEKRWKQT